MKNNSLWLVLTAVAFIGCCGCSSSRIIRDPSGASREAGVPENPPAPKEEVAGNAPGPNYVWVSGYWNWPGEWKWVAGHWEQRPSPDANYIAGHWVQRKEYWAWIPGYWKEPTFTLPK